MDTNDRNEAFFDKNDAAADNAAFDASEGELSQDELNNVSGGLRAAMKDQQPDGRAVFGPDGKAIAARPVEVDSSDPALR